MRRALPLLICCVICCITATRQADAQQRTRGNELFCENGQDLLSFVVARTSKDSNGRDMPGCSVLPRGINYTVLETSSAENKPIVKVRLRRLRGRIVDGYMLSNPE